MKIRDQRQEQLRNFGELFDITERRHKGNEQSTEAFHVIKDNLTDRERRVLSIIKLYSRPTSQGITAEEIADQMGVTVNTISGRCSSLKLKGKIYKSGTRKTRSGCSAAILKAFA
jgi:DNA-binding CsgD family transcriptional regulator